MIQDENKDSDVVQGFGREWTVFSQSDDQLKPEERDGIFDAYFHIFPWQRLNRNATGIDIGCGSGRWSVMVAPRVGHLHLIDASSEALAVARRNLGNASNVTFHLGSVASIPLPDRSLDFAFSLGVLHHVPDTQAALNSIAAKLKPGSPFLVYLYYAFDNRPAWFRAIWKASDLVRRVVSRAPDPVRLAASQTIAALVYWPLARLAALLQMLGIDPRALPLAWYRDRSFYVMRTDAYDRFCTKLELRFSRAEIEAMLIRAGFRDIQFSDREPFWCAVAINN